MAVAFVHMFCFDHDVTETWSSRNVNLEILATLFILLSQEFFVRVDSGFAFCVTRFRRHANPFELALQSLLSFSFGFFFASQTLLLLFQPRAVVPLPRNAFAAIEFENPTGDIIEKVA